MNAHNGDKVRVRICDDDDNCVVVEKFIKGSIDDNFDRDSDASVHLPREVLKEVATALLRRASG